MTILLFSKVCPHPQISQTHKGLVIVSVTRNGIAGVLGPPLDPLTLNFDATGRCIVNVLFKPLQVRLN